MLYSRTAALAVAFASIAIANPIEVRNKKTFTIDQVSVGTKVKASPGMMMLNTYAKFGKVQAAPAAVKSAAAAAASQSGTVVASPEAYDEVGHA